MTRDILQLITFLLTRALLCYCGARQFLITSEREQQVVSRRIGAKQIEQNICSNLLYLFGETLRLDCVIGRPLEKW